MDKILEFIKNNKKAAIAIGAAIVVVIVAIVVVVAVMVTPKKKVTHKSDSTQKVSEFVVKEPTETITEIPTEVPTEATTETTQQQPEPQAPVEPFPGYTFTDKPATVMYATGSVNIRTLPDTKGEIYRKASKNETLTVTGVCNETGWSRLDVDGGTYFISSELLSASYIKDAPPARNDSGNNSGNNGGGNTGNGGNSSNNGGAASSGGSIEDYLAGNLGMEEAMKYRKEPSGSCEEIKNIQRNYCISHKRGCGNLVCTEGHNHKISLRTATGDLEEAIAFVNPPYDMVSETIIANINDY